MTDQRIDVQGWLVADVEARRGIGDHEGDGRMYLFRTEADWTLFSLRMRTRYDETDHPAEGEALARATTYKSLGELRAALVKWSEDEDWRQLVRAGAANSDPDLWRLWAPVQIDEDLCESSVYRRELRVDAAGRREADWQWVALRAAVDRLEQIGFVVLEAVIDHRKVFTRGLGGDWVNPVVGAVVAARHRHRVQLVVAIDGGGEIYTRTPDTSFTPGERRRYPPRRLTDRELDAVEEIRRQRRAQAEARS